MSVCFRGMMAFCLIAVLGGCGLQQRGHREETAVQENRHSDFAKLLGEQMEGIVATYNQTPFGGPADITVGHPYISGLRTLCRRATISGSHKEIVVAACRQASGEWSLVEPVFEAMPK